MWQRTNAQYYLYLWGRAQHCVCVSACMCFASWSDCLTSPRLGRGLVSWSTRLRLTASPGIIFQVSASKWSDEWFTHQTSSLLMMQTRWLRVLLRWSWKDIDGDSSLSSRSEENNRGDTARRTYTHKCIQLHVTTELQPSQSVQSRTRGGSTTWAWENNAICLNRAA